LETSAIDTSTFLTPNSAVTIIGFPKGKYKNLWEPSYFYAKSLKKIFSGNFIDPLLSYDNGTIEGTSGSPVYYKDKKTGSYRVLAINAINPDYDSSNPRIRGGAIYFNYAFQILEALKNRNKSVDLYY
jgi:V8-like Glu-specific endopeptidase